MFGCAKTTVDEYDECPGCGNWKDPAMTAQGLAFDYFARCIRCGASYRNFRRVRVTNVTVYDTDGQDAVMVDWRQTVERGFRHESPSDTSL